MEKQHILIIDDNQDILTMLTKMLTFKGLEVSTRNDAHGILEDIQEIAPDTILMDMLLSGADGREICSQLKSLDEYRSIPVILFSAGTGARESCLESGADAFLEKPFEMNHLIDIVKNTKAAPGTP